MSESQPSLTEQECPVCGDMFTGLIMCSASCMRIFRFAEKAAGRSDPMMGSLEELAYRANLQAQRTVA